MTQVSIKTDPHMKDFEAHVKAVEEDLEYYRVKRFEPRVVHFVRRGIVTLYELLRAAPDGGDGASSAASSEDFSEHDRDHEHDELEQRIRQLEDRLDEYVKAIALTTPDPSTVDVVIDDGRTESGTYDPFFRFTHRAYGGGTLEDRIEYLDRALYEQMFVIEALKRALMRSGKLTEALIEERRAHAALVGPWNGARIVARAWLDPEFKRNLLTQGRAALREMDVPPGRSGSVLGVVENTSSVQNVVVCTLCSCYPYDLLGDPPWWYKHDTYRERIVRNPRRTLEEMFGLQVPEQTEIRVYDSTSDVRWIVLPERPAGTEGWSEAQLAQLVTRESLVGVAPALPALQPVS